MTSLIEAKDYSRLRRIVKIFRDRNWFSSLDSADELAMALENSIIISDKLSEKQFDIYCSLIEKYLFISFDSYTPRIEASLKKIPPPINPKHSFRIAPLIAPKDEGKNKSGPSIVYSIVHTNWRRIESLKNYPVEGFISIEHLRNDSAPIDEFTTLFVDDFIGSGNTLDSFYQTYKPYIHKNETVNFVCIAAMNAGIQKAENLGCKVYYSDLALKSISEADIFSDKKSAAEIIESIEDMLNISEKFRFGYEKSEGLITLQRTPNNTLPLFWANNNFGGIPWPSPFPRFINNPIRKSPKK